MSQLQRDAEKKITPDSEVKSWDLQEDENNLEISHDRNQDVFHQ